MRQSRPAVGFLLLLIVPLASRHFIRTFDVAGTVAALGP